MTLIFQKRCFGITIISPTYGATVDNLSSPPVVSGYHVAQSLVFCIIFCGSLLVLLTTTYAITDVVSSNLDQDKVYNICDKICQRLATGRWSSPGTPVSSTNKTDHNDITEILLKVVFNTIKQTKTNI